MIWTFDLPIEATRPWANSRRDYGHRMHRRWAISTAQLFAVMLFGLGLAACGDDGDDASSTTSTVSEGADDTTTTVSEVAVETTTTTVPETSPTTTEQEVEAFVVVSGTGLSVLETDGADSPTLDFGANRSEVIETVRSVLGAAPLESDGSAECPNAQASVATWPDLILDFDANDRFLSWRLPVGSQLTDADGLGLGSARSDLGDTLLASIDESSLGTEFGMSGSVSGLLTGPEEDATVNVLWAGDICAFR